MNNDYEPTPKPSQMEIRIIDRVPTWMKWAAVAIVAFLLWRACQPKQPALTETQPKEIKEQRTIAAKADSTASAILDTTTTSMHKGKKASNRIADKHKLPIVPVKIGTDTLAMVRELCNYKSMFDGMD